MNTKIDTNVDNYTLSELLLILDLNTISDKNEMIKSCNKLIEKFERQKDTTMVNFFNGIKKKLSNYYDQIKTDQDNYEQDKHPDENQDIQEPSAKAQTDNWINNQYLTQKNKSQNDKTTERKQKIDVYASQHVPMKQQQLGINNNYNVEVSQDVLNPNLKNITSRFISIDSQFRQATTGVESTPTDYTLDLSEPLNNTLSLRLYSIQIPYSWYAVDSFYGRSCFWIVISPTITVNITMPSGNYSPTQFVSVLITEFQNSNITSTNPNNLASYNSNNGKMTINLYNASYNGILITETAQIVFFDVTGKLTCGSTVVNSTNNINNTIGWLMGYRSPYVYVENGGNESDTLIDLYGPKYLILSIDDYNQNHINNGLITITELSKNLKLPSYYNTSIPTTVLSQQNNLSKLMNSNENNNGDLLMEKMSLSFKNIPQILPSAPRVLTQAQIYTVNEIIKNNERNTNFRSRAPTNSDTFALIPVKHNYNNTMGDVYVEFGGSMQDNRRTYFGPVNIDRMRIKLFDDKGNVLNLNGGDWSFTLISEILYQY
jgi:hypothetical protein